MEKKDHHTKKEPLTVVAIGASAGGLNALKLFFAQVPEDTGLAFVIVVHLSPDYESHLADLLQPHVKIPVQQVTQNLRLKPDNVYVIPPGCNLSAIDTHLRLSDLEKNRIQRAPIDHFFRTLAKTHDGHSVGVILTGTGSDGTLGMRKIKERGGLIIVQDPVEAEFDGMPVSAISTGMVDLVLPIHEIPKEILRYTGTRPKISLSEDGEEVREKSLDFLHKVFTHVRSRTGRDFSRYKRSTLMRRLERRMQIHHLEEPEKYLQLLRNKPEEVKELSDDFLINVTSFFRDPDVYKMLEEKVIPQLFKNKKAGEQVRIWSVGCATGEEAYSLAMLLLEEVKGMDSPPSLQVFASDLHEHSLQKAREGFYPGDIEADVSPDRLKRFFNSEDGGYRVRKEVRELVVFAPHNLLGDPPFSRMDMVTCRNVLIYLQRDVQGEIIELFHYALRPDGFMLLGSSETSENMDLFRAESKQHCLYRKRNVPVREPRLPVFPLGKPNKSPLTRLKEFKETPMSYDSLHRHMQERYAPPSLLLGSNQQVIHLSEGAGRYLEHPGGSPTTNLFRILREELRLEARATLYKAMSHLVPTHSKVVSLRIDGSTIYLRLSLYPGQKDLDEDLNLLVFHEVEHPEGEKKINEGERAGNGDEVSVKELQNGLGVNQQRLQAVLEEFETSQEEMKAANEELQSANEELLSTMEELETSKEELQSVNEELITLNQENRHKVEELSLLTNDLQNLLTATDIATIYLDRQMRILRFTPRVSELFNVRQTDRGRPISDFTHKLGYEELLEDAEKVLKSLVPRDREVKDQEGSWYLTRTLPYRSNADRIEGVVITFVEISERKKMEEELRKSEERFRSLFLTMKQGFCLLEKVETQGEERSDFRYLMANPAFEQHTGLYDLENKTIRQVVHDAEDSMIDVYDEVLATEEHRHFEGYVSALDIWIEVEAFPAPDKRQVAVLFSNISKRKKDEQKQQYLLKLNDVLRSLTDAVEIEEAVTSAAMAHFRADRCYYAVIEGDVAIIRKDAFREGLASVAEIYQLREVPRFKSILESNRPLAVPDVNASDVMDEELKQLFLKCGILAYIYIPVIKGQELVGFFCIGQSVPREWLVMEVELAVETAERTCAIMERAKVEKALRKSEEQFRLFVMASSEMVYKMNADWSRMHYLKGNNFLVDTTNSISNWAREYIPVEEQKQVQAAIRRAIQNKCPFEFEHRVIQADGSIGWVHSRAVPIQDENGEIIEWFGTGRDISERKKADEELVRAKELAEAAGKAKEDFVSTMSHEIRTPLNAVIGLTHLLLTQDPREDQHENLCALDFSARNLMALINGILDFSKLEAGKATVAKNDFDLLDLLLNLKQAHQPQAAENGTQLKISLGGNIPERISTDQLKLSQILHNLVSNAVKFTRNGEVQIEVRNTAQEGDIHYLNFAVQDNGIGISEENQRHIFEKFTQANAATAVHFGGTGLGLSITKMLLELLESEIQLESKEGQGSRFSFCLPVKNVELETRQKETVLNHQNTADFERFRLLIVEDVEINRKILTQMLKNWWQLRPDEAVNGREAVEKAKQTKYDLILMDVRMPEMDGCEASRNIRQIEGYTDVPILALTADKGREVQHALHSGDFSDLVTKPFDSVELQNKIFHYLTAADSNFSSTLPARSGALSNKKGADDPTQSVEFYSLAIQHLEEYQQVFSEALVKRDLRKLDDMGHKAKVLISALGLEELTGLLRNAKKLIKRNVTDEKLENLRKQGGNVFERTIQLLKEEKKSL